MCCNYTPYGLQSKRGQSTIYLQDQVWLRVGSPVCDQEPSSRVQEARSGVLRMSLGAGPLRLWAVEGGGSSFQAVDRATKWRLLRGVNWID